MSESNKKHIYLDYNATTPVHPQVLQSMLPYFTTHFGNPSSSLHEWGWVAEQAVENARQQVASLLGATSPEIYFTSGATESLNWAIKSIVEVYKNKGNHIITTLVEHSAVLAVLRFLEQKQKIQLTYLEVDTNGQINIHDLQNAVQDTTIAVIIGYANNETGILQTQMAAISQIVHSKKAIVLSDTTQAVGKIKTLVDELGIDIACVSGHKIYAPKGVGAIYIRRKNPRVVMEAMLHGGEQENDLRAGTLNVPGIVGLGKACELAKQELAHYQNHTKSLQNTLESLLTTKNNSIHIIGKNTPRLPNTSAIYFEEHSAADIVKIASTVGFSIGSACNSNSKASHVLLAMHFSEKMTKNTIRISTGWDTTQEDIHYFCNQIV